LIVNLRVILTQLDGSPTFIVGCYGNPCKEQTRGSLHNY